MKLNYENTIKIRDWFNSKEISPNCDPDTLFEIYKSIQYFGSIVQSKSFTKRVSIIKVQIDYIRKSIVNILYEDNNKSASGLKNGYVYAITNPAWPEYIKVGAAIDVYDRLSSYKTSSPLRDYELLHYVYSSDRLSFEKQVLSSFDRDGEWVKASKKEVIDKLNSHSVYPEEEINKFALQETIRVYCEENRGSPKKSVAIALKSCAKQISEYYGIDYDELKSLVGSSKNYKKTACNIFFRPLNLTFRINEDGSATPVI